jgi:sugar lactone lactonase YvrE
MALATSVLLDGLAFPEGPRWRDGKLWFSDMHDHRVLTVDPNGRAEHVVEVPAQPSGLGWLPDGRLLVVSMTDRKLMRLEGERLRLHADLSELASFHLNDMVVDARGRAYVGNFGFDLIAQAAPSPAELILVTPDGGARVVAEKLDFPNGSVITPDGRTLIVAESFGARLTAFDIAEDGSLAGRRVWAQLEGAVPDGICLDAEGAVWLASPPFQQVLRVREGGEVVERIDTGQQAIACMLGGPERRTLFVLTAPGIDPEECRAARGARIETLQVEVAGAGLP